MSEIEIKDRILKFLTKQKLSSSRFAEIIGVQRSSISHILSGRNKPSLDFLQKILSNFPNLNSDWLILGKGEMDTSSIQTQMKFENNSTNPTPTLNQQIIENKIQTVPIQEMAVKEVKRRLIKKIVVFYDDNTFEELKPDKANEV